MKIVANQQSSLNHLRQRLARLLLHVAAGELAGRRFLSLREMAAKIGTTSESINGALTSMEKEGAIRIERNKMIIDPNALEIIASDYTDSRAYVLLRTRMGNWEEAVTIIRDQPGVVMADSIEGMADVIFAVQGSTPENLANLMVHAIAAVEDMTDEIQLLPVK
jgi:DNA-binding transcriptional regulator YhcF (GntR family)